jgi:hypothetical protein
VPDFRHCAESFGSRIWQLTRQTAQLFPELQWNQWVAIQRERGDVGKRHALCPGIMLNLNKTNELIELGCRAWWLEKQENSAAYQEHPLSVEHDSDLSNPRVDPTTVYFTIELA